MKGENETSDAPLIRPSSRRPLRKRVRRFQMARRRGPPPTRPQQRWRRCRAKESPCRGQGVLCRQLVVGGGCPRSCPVRCAVNICRRVVSRWRHARHRGYNRRNPRRRHHHHRRRHHRRRRLPPPPPPAAAAATTTRRRHPPPPTPPPSAPPSPPPCTTASLAAATLTASHDAATRAATIATASLAASYTPATQAASSCAASLAGAPLPASRSSARWRPFLLYRIPFRAASTISTLLHDLLSRWWQEADEAFSTTAISTARTAGFPPLGRLCGRREEGTATRASSATTSTATAKAFGGVGWARRA